MPSSAPVLMSGSQYSRKCRFVKAENYSICQIPPLNGARSSASHPLAMGRGALSTQPAANSGRAQLPQPGFSPNPCTACVPVFRAHKSVSQPACNVKPSTPVLASCAVQAKLWGAYSAGCQRLTVISQGAVPGVRQHSPVRLPAIGKGIRLAELHPRKQQAFAGAGGL